jgi:3-oxoacyl-[acyl-carrier protein] reductase
MIEMHPLRRLGTTEDVASAALYLASDESSWVTGIILDVTGGAVMR